MIIVLVIGGICGLIASLASSFRANLNQVRLVLFANEPFDVFINGEYKASDKFGNTSTIYVFTNYLPVGPRYLLELR